MKQLTARSMEEGAWGLVTRFESGGPEHPQEVIALAKVVASYGGNYTSHHGSEGYDQADEITFAIRVAEEAQIPVHLFHFKIRARQNWGTIDNFIAQIEEAPRSGAGHYRESVPVHRHVPRLERFLPPMGARGWSGPIRRATPGRIASRKD